MNKFHNVVNCFNQWKRYDHFCRTLKLQGESIRRPNLSEYISENIVQKIIMNTKTKHGYYKCKKSNGRGDLIRYNYTIEEIVEVKASISNGPSSFGPLEKWHILYWLDMKKDKDYFYVHKFKIPSTSPIYLNYHVNKNETIADQIKQKRRPRFHMKQFITYLNDNEYSHLHSKMKTSITMLNDALY